MLAAGYAGAGALGAGVSVDPSDEDEAKGFPFKDGAADGAFSSLIASLIEERISSILGSGACSAMLIAFPAHSVLSGTQLTSGTIADVGLKHRVSDEKLL